MDKKSPQQEGASAIWRRVAMIACVAALLALVPLLIWASLPSGSSTSAAPAAAPTGGGGYFDAMIESRKKARSTVAGMELTQIFAAFRMYAVEHNEALPDKLEDLAAYLDGFDQLTLNPRTGKNDRFIYTKPAATWNQVTNPSTTPLVNEAATDQPNRFLATLYADGHVELGK